MYLRSVLEKKFGLGVGAPGAVGDRAEDGEPAFGFLHGFADVVFVCEAAVEVDPQVLRGGGRGVLGCDALDCGGDVMGHGLWVGMEDPDASLAWRKGKFPEGEPAGDVVQDDLDIPQL